MTRFHKGKKDDEMKPLSEEEIQKKLYGSYIKTDATITDESHEEAEKEIQKGAEEEEHTESDIKPAVQSVEVFTLTEQDLFSSHTKTSEDDQRVRIEKPEIDSISETENNIASEDTMTSEDLEDHLVSEQQQEETVAYAIDPQQTSPVVEEQVKQEKAGEALKNFISSLKIDVGEFFDRVKSISPMLVGVLVGIVVLLIVGFNIWSKYNSETDVSSISAPVVVAASRLANNELPLAETTVESRVSRLPERPVKITRVLQPETDSNLTPPAVNQEELNSFYSIQICVYEDTDRAEHLVSKLKGLGFDAFYKKVVSRSGRVFYTVFTGRFAERAQATEAFESFKKSDIFKSFPDSFIKFNK